MRGKLKNLPLFVSHEVGERIFAEGKNPQGKRKRSSIHRLRQRVEIKKLERKFGLFSFSRCEVGERIFAEGKNPKGKRKRSSIHRLRQRVEVKERQVERLASFCFARSRGNEFLPKAKTRRASASVVQFIDFARGLR